jgi:prepilin peptidase dependent protein D
MTKKIYLSKAFSLIELIIIIAIVAILSTIAIPSYINYILTSKVTAMYEATAPSRFIVTNDYKNSCSGINYTFNSGTGSPSFLKPSNYISSMSITNGVISVTGNATALSNNAINLTVTPSADSTRQLTWTCCVDSSFFNYAPSVCQNATSVCTAIPAC